MSNARGAPNTITVSCPEWGQVRYVLDSQVTTSRRRGLLGRHTFEMSVQGPPWQAQHAVAPPLLEANGPLGPGESVYRPMNADADVTTPLRYALVWAGEVAALAGTVALGAEVSWWITAIGAPAVLVFGGVWYLATRPILRNAGLDLDNWLKTRARDPETPAAQVAPRAYPVRGELKTSPTQILYLKFDLETEHSQLAWHRFCKAVQYKGRNFSGREARNHGLSATEWEHVLAAFVAQGWATDAGPRETSQLIGPGHSWVRLYADTPPEN